MTTTVPPVEPAEEAPVPFEAPGIGLIPGYVAGWCWHRVAGSEWRAGFRVCEHGCEKVDAYVVRAGRAYVAAGNLVRGDAVAALDFANGFIRAHWQVCRHYRPEAIGEGLWATVRSHQSGYWVSLSAGRHQDGWDTTKGSFRDDGAYLALMLLDDPMRPASAASWAHPFG